MSSTNISFHSYPGLGQSNSDLYHYSQAVRIGPVVRCAGQGGFDEQGEIIKDMKEQVEMVFRNVERALQDAGSKGWSQAVSVRSYHLDLDASFEVTVEMFRKFMPMHRPVWVAVGVAKLGEGMHVEMEVEAHDDLKM